MTRKAISNQLKSASKGYFPQVFDLISEDLYTNLSALAHKYGDVFMSYAACFRFSILSTLVFASSRFKSLLVNFHWKGLAIS